VNNKKRDRQIGEQPTSISRSKKVGLFLGSKRVQADKRTENVTSNEKIKINHKPYIDDN
jgi:hypothetical protein